MEKGHLVVTDYDLWAMLLSTVRYALGRQTNIVEHSVELIIKYSVHLTTQQLKQLHREINHEITRHEAMGRFVGSKLDHNVWVNSLLSIEEIINGLGSNVNDTN